MDANTPMTNMTPAEMRDFADRMEHSAAVKDHNDREARIAAQVEAATALSLSGNQQYQLLQSGQLSQRVTVQNGQTTVENLRAPTNMGNTTFSPPQALIDQVALDIGGINLAPKQAQEMLAQGMISETDYYAALGEALAPYGYSFR